MAGHALLIDGLTNHVADLGHFEIHEIRAIRSARPEESLRGEATVREMDEMPDASDRGYAIVDVELFDADDHRIAGFTTKLHISKKPRN
ncbi:MAG: hypothetical protein AAF978_09140 [Cyanobacteria bacterium P01_E01_bin.48]